MSDGTIEAGYQTATFGLTIDGVELGRFTRAQGLHYSVAAIPAEAKTEDGQTIRYKVPGRITYAPVTLTRPLTDSNAMLEWHKKTSDEGDTERKTGEIVIYDRMGQRRGAWAFEGGFLSSWMVSGASAGQDALLEEVVSISVDRIYRADS